MTTFYHAKSWAHALTLRGETGSIESLSGSIAGSRVDLNPHQVDAALFAIRSPLTRDLGRILRAIQGDPEITMAKLARETGLTPKGVEWNIRKLKDAGALKRIGRDRGGRWEVVP